MNNKKCPNCGFINFLNDESCRKCEASLDSLSGPAEPYAGSSNPAPYAGSSNPAPYAGPPNPYASGQYYQYQTAPAKEGFPVLKVSLGILVGFIVLSALTGAGAVFLKRNSKVEWREFRGDGSDVVVMMPKEPRAGEPIITPMAVGTITNHPYTATVMGQGAAMYCIVDFSFNLDASGASHEKMLEGELNDLLKRTNSTLINKQNIKSNGFSGVLFEMYPPGDANLDNGKSFGEMFIARNKLYLLVLTASADSELLKGKDKFLNLSIPNS